MDISINFLFKSKAELKLVKNKIIDLFKVCYSKNIGREITNLSDTGLNCNVGVNHEYPIFSLQINENEFKPFHQMAYYSEFLELLKQANVKYNELYVNDESVGTFFSVYPSRNKNHLEEYEMTGVGYFHAIRRKNISEKIIKQLKETNQYFLKENNDWLIIFRSINI